MAPQLRLRGLPHPAAKTCSSSEGTRTARRPGASSRGAGSDPTGLSSIRRSGRFGTRSLFGVVSHSVHYNLRIFWVTRARSWRWTRHPLTDERSPPDLFRQGIRAEKTHEKYTRTLRKIACDIMEDVLQGDFEERVAASVGHDKEHPDTQDTAEDLREDARQDRAAQGPYRLSQPRTHTSLARKSMTIVS